MTSGDERLLRLLKDAREKLESERRRRTEPLAIVGMGCRFPGGASSPEAFWQLLASGVDATSDVPADRWDADALYDPDPARPGKAYARRGAFLDSIDGFEPEFFGISPREAVGMDPQQRLLLEVGWEALEDAGIPPDSLRGSATGVWVGLSLDDYASRSVTSGDLARIDPYTALGNARSVAAGRIAYVLDLHGPVMQIDASCASSLVALHLACQSLRAAECDVALVGGVNLMSSPEATVALCKLRALAPDGRCKTFDAAADGYGRGEGCGVVVLQRLADARAARRRIHAVVRGSAVNHDGRSNGLTAPNGAAQEAVIQGALASAGLAASSVGYVEAHGTGTLLGDPIEVLALSRVYGPGRSPEAPLLIGSVKTNFGHLEGAAGIAGLIKSALCLSHGQIAPHLHLRQPNPRIPWQDLPLRVATEGAEWPRDTAPRVAGVSAFGMSGTNAHVLLEEAPARAPQAPAPARSAELVVLSARTDAALRASAGRLREEIDAHPEWRLGDVAYSLATTRSRMGQRWTCPVPTLEALGGALDAAAGGETPAYAARARARESPGRVALLFAGQGAQQLGMGRALHAEWPVFRQALDVAFAALDGHLDRPLREVMWAEPGTADARLLDQTAYTQPALFAFGWALAALWRSWGLRPDLVAGHSIGELTAACVAQVFTLEDAARLVCARGRWMQSLPGRGAMVAIAAPEAEVARAIERDPHALAIAAVNAPSSVVVSGEEAAVTAVAERFAARGVAVKRLAVSHAFHSPLMDPMLEPFRDVARSVRYRAPSIGLVSSLTGKLAGAEVANADYWVRHVREPVRFEAAALSLQAAGAQVFLELGPKATLVPLVAASLPEPPSLLLACGRVGRTESAAVLDALGAWVAHGGDVDAEGLFPQGGRRLELPTYPWQRARYWIEARTDLEGLAPQPPAPSERAAGPTNSWARDVAALPADERAGAVTRAVRADVARILSFASPGDVALDRPLPELGLDSLMAVELRSAVGNRTGVTLPAALVSGSPTVHAIAAHLLAEAARLADARVAERGRPAAFCEGLHSVAGARARLVCFHDAGGSSTMFVPFCRLATEGVEVHAVSPTRGLDASAATAREYLHEAVRYVRSLSDRPYALFGHSLGGLFAWRVLQEIVAGGAPLPALFFPSASRRVTGRRPGSGPFLVDDADAEEAFLRVFGDRATETEPLRAGFEADVRLWRSMGPIEERPVHVPIAAFVGHDDHVVDADAMRSWAPWTTGGFSLTVLPGGHFYLAEDPSRRLLLDELARRLAG